MQKEWKYAHKPIWETSKYSYCNRHRKEFEKAKEIEAQEIEEEIEKKSKAKEYSTYWRWYYCNPSLVKTKKRTLNSLLFLLRLNIRR